MSVVWVPATSQDLSPSPPRRESRPSVSHESEGILQTLQRQALPDLIHSITEKKQSKKLRITHIAGDIENHEASQYLVDAYAQTSAEGVRCKIIESIGKFHDPEMLGWLAERLKNPHISIQCFAIWAMGELKTPRAAALLLPRLWSSNRYIQMTVIDALGKTGKNGAVASELSTFLRDEDVQVRYLVAKALMGTAGPDAAPVLAERLMEEPSVDVQEALARTLGRTGGAVGIGHLIELLKYPPSQATEHWAEVGLEAADPALVFPVIEPFANGDDFRLKVAALRILNELRKTSR